MTAGEEGQPSLAGTLAWVSWGKCQESLFTNDEHPRETTLETPSRLPTIFREYGTVTPGNASGLNVGGGQGISTVI
jgi:acetyl-CoA acetyltransferase